MNNAGPKQSCGADGYIHHRRFNSDLCRTAVNNQRNFVTKEFLHVLGSGGRKPAGGVRTWRGQWKLAFADDSLNERMTWPAHPDRVTAACDCVRDGGGFWQHKSQRTGPKRFCQFFRSIVPIGNALGSQLPACDVNNDRIMRRTPLDFKNLADGVRIQRIRGQTINRLRRDRYDLARAQQRGRACYCGIELFPCVRGQNLSHVNAVSMCRFQVGFCNLELLGVTTTGVEFGVISAKSEKQAMDWSLVLISQGIENTIEHSPETHQWHLTVPQYDYQRAIKAIKQYHVENKRGVWVRELPWSDLL